MRVFFLSLFLLIVFVGTHVIAPYTDAQLLNPKAKEALNKTTTEFSGEAGFAEASKTTVYELIGTTINTLLSFLGVLFLGLLIYGGFIWLNSQGSEEDVQKAKRLLTQAVIGIFIVLSSYILSAFIVRTLQNKTLKTPVRALSSPFV